MRPSLGGSTLSSHHHQPGANQPRSNPLIFYRNPRIFCRNPRIFAETHSYLPSRRSKHAMTLLLCITHHLPWLAGQSKLCSASCGTQACRAATWKPMCSPTPSSNSLAFSPLSSPATSTLTMTPRALHACRVLASRQVTSQPCAQRECHLHHHVHHHVHHRHSTGHHSNHGRRDVPSARGKSPTQLMRFTSLDCIQLCRLGLT